MKFSYLATRRLVITAIVVGLLTRQAGATEPSPPPAVAPFAAEQAKSYQVTWAEYLATSVERQNSLGMTVVLIPPGEFMMGSSPEQIER
ncbi:MAG: hypothetical protein AB7O38_30625, partial [Pirellulaceae bacterium]